MVIVSKLKKVFPDGTVALDGISLKVEEGQFTVILGPSGAGKTTLLRSINGLVKPSKGDVTVDGIKVIEENYREIRTLVGMVFQHFNLVGNLSVLKNVLSGSLGTHQKWWSNLFLFPKASRIKALDLLDRVGLLDKAYNRADELSGGEQQRVGIARALVQDPVMILCDEPISSLDPSSAKIIMDYLRKIQNELGITILVNLHQVDVAKKYAERILGFNSGQLVFDAPPSDLTTDTIHQIYGTEVGELIID